MRSVKRAFRLVSPRPVSSHRLEPRRGPRLPSRVPTSPFDERPCLHSRYFLVIRRRAAINLQRTRLEFFDHIFHIPRAFPVPPNETVPKVSFRIGDHSPQQDQ